MAAEPVVQTLDIVKRFDDVLALDHLNLSIQPGEVVGLLGPNGAGKTTTINLLLGVLSPTSGKVRLFGQELERHRSSLLRRVNFASAYAGLPRNLTLWENLRIFADFYEVPDGDRRVAEVIEELALQPLVKRTVMQLSAGQRMRAVLAKAILSRPELLLLDEPTASLDPDTAVRVREYLLELATRGVTLVWASHNMAEVESHCSRVIFLYGGRVALDGPPKELARRSGGVLLRLKPMTELPAPLRDHMDGNPRELGSGWLEATADDEAQAAEIVASIQNAVGLAGLEMRPPTLEDLFVRLARDGET